MRRVDVRESLFEREEACERDPSFYADTHPLTDNVDKECIVSRLLLVHGTVDAETYSQLRDRA